MDIGKEMLLALLYQIRETHHIYLSIVRKRGSHADLTAVELAKKISRDWDTYYMLKEVYRNRLRI